MTSSLIFDDETGAVLVGVGEGPPQVGVPLADKGFDEITAVVVLRHFHTVPYDGDLVSIAGCLHVLRRSVHVAADALQVRLHFGQHTYVANHIHNRRCDPARIGKFFELDIEPVTIHASPTRDAFVACVQVCCMQVGGGGSIAAVRLLVDSCCWLGKSWRGGDGGCQCESGG